MKPLDGHAFTIQQRISGDKWDLETKALYRPEVERPQDQLKLARMRRHFERLCSFCALQSGVVS
jgi:hypothetical protein